MRVSEHKTLGKHLVRLFGDIDLVEAQMPLPLQFSKAVIAASDPDDATCCILATAAKNAGSTAALVLNRAAFLDRLDGKGVRKCFRYVLSLPAQRVVRSFDAAGHDKKKIAKLKPVSVTLLPPSLGETLQGQRQRHKEAAERATTLEGKQRKRAPGSKLKHYKKSPGAEVAVEHVGHRLRYLFGKKVCATRFKH